MTRIETYNGETRIKTARRGTTEGLCQRLGLALPAALLIIGLGAGTAEARCKSFAGEEETAVEYCEGVLKCSEKKPKKQITKCTGRTNDWKCRCVADPAGGQNNIEGLLLETDDNSPALLGALAGALNGLSTQQPMAVSTPYDTHTVPSALEAAHQDNRDRERNLARAQELYEQRKRDRDKNHGHQNTVASETGTDTGTFQDGEATETAAGSGEGGTPSETGDATGTFEATDANANLGAFGNALGRYSGDGGCGFTALELIANAGLILAIANGQIPLSVSGSQATGQKVTLFGVTGRHLAILLIQGALQITGSHPGGGSCSAQFHRA